MPYRANADLPGPVREHLPQHAQDIFRAAFNAAWEAHGKAEETAFRIAWAAVKRRYRKVGGAWIER